MSEIDIFLKDFDNLLLDEHRLQIMKYRDFLNEYRSFPIKSSIYGEHYSCCVWSDSEAKCGPDTCACFHVHKYLKDFKRLEIFYKKITRTSKNNNN